jgi:signal peptidase II
MHGGRAAARRVAALRSACVFVLVVALDQITKHTLGTWIEPGQVRHLVPGITLVYERNTGVAFTGLALLVLVSFMLLRPQRPLLWLPTGMLIGGAVGNLIDRVARGSVIDFIKLPHWPAFNFADISITFGAIILALVIERGTRKTTDG